MAHAARGGSACCTLAPLPDGAMRRVTVYGRLQEVSEWFGNLGCKLPYGVNVADFILDLASGEFEDSRPMLGVMGTERKEKLIEVRYDSCTWPMVPCSGDSCVGDVVRKRSIRTMHSCK